jgi:predicted ABC-type ATPase
MSLNDFPPPVFTIVAGLPGVGKTLVLDALKRDHAFPECLVVDTANDVTVSTEAILDAVVRKVSLVIETSFNTPAPLDWLNLAEQHGYQLELIVIGVEQEILRTRRGGQARRSRAAMRLALARLVVATDLVRRTLIIDNSTSQPSVAGRIEAGKTIGIDTRLNWVVKKVVGPRVARHRSLTAIREAYDAIAAHSTIQPMLQMAVATKGLNTGSVVATSECHLLLRIGEALHVVHDLGLLGLTPGAAVALAAQSTVTLGGEGPLLQSTPGLER